MPDTYGLFVWQALGKPTVGVQYLSHHLRRRWAKSTTDFLSLDFLTKYLFYSHISSYGRISSMFQFQNARRLFSYIWIHERHVCHTTIGHFDRFARIGEAWKCIWFDAVHRRHRNLYRSTNCWLSIRQNTFLHTRISICRQHGGAQWVHTFCNASSAKVC